MGKKRFDRKILVCVEDKMYNDLKKESDKRNVTVSVIIRELISQRKAIKKMINAGML